MRLAQSIAAALLMAAALADCNVLCPQAYAKDGETDPVDASASDSDDDVDVPDPDDAGGEVGSSDAVDDDVSDVDAGAADADPDTSSDTIDIGADDNVPSDDSDGGTTEAEASGSVVDETDDAPDEDNDSGSVGGSEDSSGTSGGDDSSGSGDNSGSSGSGDDDPSGGEDDSGSSGSGSSGDDTSGGDDNSGSSGHGNGGDDSSGSEDNSGPSGSGGTDDDSSSSNDSSGSSGHGSGSADSPDGDDSGSSGSGSSDAGSGDDKGSAESQGEDSGTPAKDDRSGSENSDKDDEGSDDSLGSEDSRDAELPTSQVSENPVEVEYLGGGEESETQRAALDEKDGIETDREGFRYRRNEFVALDLDEDEISKLRESGFTVLQSQPLEGAGGTIHLVKGPSRLSDTDAFTMLDGLSDPDSLSFNHLFDSSSGEIRKQRTQTIRTRPACGCKIGMIDTGIADRLPFFSHVSIEQRAFNSSKVDPRQHGTAVAHQFAGTAPLRDRRTRILVADIFSGDRGTAGSTFSLVRALDWLSTTGVGVINVSLAGPRNPVVAATIARLEKRGHLIVAAAGNDGPAAPPVFPGAYRGVVAVTAVDAKQQVYRYANRGTYVDFAAPGVSIAAINTKGQFTAATGTSFAAPAVAARLARVLEGPDPAASSRAVSKLASEARDLGKPGRDTTYGYGLVGDAQ